MRVAIGSDHAGYALKEALKPTLVELGHEVIDLGTDSGEVSVDYPIFCVKVGHAVADGDADRGIVIGGSGNGEQMSANKVPGVRAALCNDLYTARYARLHNDANVLSLGARVAAEGLAQEIVGVFFATEFEGGRHVRRLEELTEIERGEL